MDSGKLRRVALAAGLLFCFVAVTGCLFLRASQARFEEEAKIMAKLTETDPAGEAEFAGIITGKSNEEGADTEDGKKLLEKYGYTFEDSMRSNGLWIYAGGLGVVLAAGFLAAGAAGWYCFREKKKEKDRAEYLKGRLLETQNRSEKMEDRLRKEEQETKALITDISHQLKTPIASLKMSYEIEDATELSEEERAEFIRKEREDVSRMENLLQAFVQMTRLETGMIRLKQEKNSLRETLKQAVGGVYMKALKKEILIETEEFPELVIRHDPKWTAEAFGNVLDNAVKYAPAGSRVRIQVSEMVSFVMVEIEDEGPGIPEKERGKIFQRFYRGEQKNVQETEGAGVGLYLTRQILERQKGTVFVKPGRNGGSKFVMTLPKE